jgi:uncharacterized membrane protein
MPNQLSDLGIVHTALALVALVSGAVTLIQNKEISLATKAGRLYLACTLLTAVTSYGIFAHGHPTPGHYVAALTILALAVGYAAARGAFGKASRSVQAASWSLTVLFHLIPGFTETLTRLPPSAPLVSSPEAPIFQVIYPALLLAYLVGVFLQIRYLRKAPAPAAPHP